jgi:hypothetical protein
MKNFEKIQKALLPTKSAAAADESTFLQWERGEISTAICLRRFRIHNMVDKDADISQIDLETWLESLGYRRRKGNAIMEYEEGASGRIQPERPGDKPES